MVATCRYDFFIFMVSLHHICILPCSNTLHLFASLLPSALRTAEFSIKLLSFTHVPLSVDRQQNKLETVTEKWQIKTNKILIL